MKVYLSGWTGEVGYRKYVLENYSEVFDIKDPLSEVEKKMDLDVEGYKTGKIDFTVDTINSIVEGDIDLLKTCDTFVAMVYRYSAGTMMEIRIAYELDMPIYLITHCESMKRDIWLRYHSNMFFNCTKDCFEFLKTYGENFACRGR